MKQRKRNSPAVVNSYRPKGTFLEAAAKILKHARQPLTSREITDRAIASGLLKTEGKTPDQTMVAALYMDILHNPATRFRRIAQPGPTRARRNSVKWALRD